MKGCKQLASVGEFCHSHYIDHGVMGKSYSRRPKNKQPRYNAAPLQDLIRRRTLQVVAEDDRRSAPKTSCHLAKSHGLTPRTLKDAMNETWIAEWRVDNICCKLGVHPAEIYGLDWM